MDCWVVVVDDDPFYLESTKRILGTSNMKVSCLRSGSMLLKFMEKNSPDLILLDIMMPQMGGFETFQELRRLEKQVGRAEIPVIFLTGEKDNDTENRGLTLGASDYIYKPFDRDILISRIKNTVLRNKRIERLTEDATIDKLTGFLNKKFGTERIAGACESLNGSLMVLDLDSFKLVNDLFGHEAGDRVLAAFADVVRRNTRGQDTVCRIGGDEFMAFFCNISVEYAVNVLALRLNEQLAFETEKILGEDHGIPLGVSVGAIMVPEYGRDAQTLFRMADKAMYTAKQNGKHRAFVYSDKEAVSVKEDTPEEELVRLTKIIEERGGGDSGDALIMGIESFSIIYKFLMRFNKRYGGKTLKLLFIVTADDSTDYEAYKELITGFGETLKRVLRKSDIILQNRVNQFLVLLPMMDNPDEGRVVERIFESWNREVGHELVHISYASEIE
ncbi:MAG TPA: hypothetical protein DCL38_04005 [Lachnospiraceae bacterium]|nr:hypothetical protein [Lachnospiraceae bacterium]